MCEGNVNRNIELKKIEGKSMLQSPAIRAGCQIHLVSFKEVKVKNG